TIALCITMLAYALASNHFLARPHTLSYPLAILWISGLIRAVERGAMPSFLLLPVMTLWANMHGGFTLGFAVCGFLALESIYESEPKCRLELALRWMLFFTASMG